jgi:hypothetical protein
MTSSPLGLGLDSRDSREVERIIESQPCSHGNKADKRRLVRGTLEPIDQRNRPGRDSRDGGSTMAARLLKRATLAGSTP